ncbi:MAG: hypothetical protein ACO2PN_22615 [Pyrobaculum sp.]|jgi:F0F1-type ATP synthase delta subunit
MEMWRRRRKAASARLSAALYSVYSGLYSEAVVSSVASAVVLAEVGRFREAVQYVQRAAKALYEAAKETFEKVKVTVQRLVELFVEAVTRVLARIDEHKAYLFLMAAAAVALNMALDMWGLIELEKLACAASVAPFFAGLADAGGKAAERFRTLAERWKVDDKEEKKIENIIKEIINAPLRGETSQSSRRPYGALLKLAEQANLPKPLVELREALKDVQDEVVQDAAVVAALVLYKTLINNAGAYREWAELYKWARGLVEKQEFAVTAGDIERLREAHRGLEEVAEEVREELNGVLALYKSHSRDLYEKLKQHLEVDVKKAEELAEARRSELSKYSDASMGTKAYAALLSIARGGLYGHAAMLLMMEGALADVVLLTPTSAYNKAKRIAKGRGEAVDPSRSRKGTRTWKVAGGRGGAVDLSRVEEDWKDRAASVLLRFLIGYGEVDPRLLSGAGETTLKFRLIERGGKKDDEKKRVERGFQVFRVYGGVETPVGELWIGKTAAHFTLSKEELKRLMEEAKKHKPDLSGIKKIRQTLEWFNTDVSFTGRWIVATTADTRQAAWYVALFGEPESISGRASITEEGIKFYVVMRWRRERLDRIIAAEGEELKPHLGRTVKSWRELVDAIDWSWVSERVGKLTGELKSWIGPESADDAEREELARRMLGELALLVHFAEARKVKDDGEMGKEGAKRLSRAVEALSCGRIKGDHAKELAQAIILYAGGQKKEAEELIEKLVKGTGVSREEVRGVVEFVLGDMYYEWRAERAARLAKAVETLSGGRITGEYAVKLAKLIILYAESRDERTKNRIDKLAEELAGVFKEDVKRVKGEVWGVVDFILSDMHCLARDCARDAVVRKYVAPALELIMLDKALNDNNESNRKRARLLFGEMYATAIAGDGTVGRRRVGLTVGGELGGGAALLRLATLHLLNQLLPRELKFNTRAYEGKSRYYNIVAYGENATRFKRLLAVSAPSAGGRYLSDKFNGFVEEAQVDVRVDSIRLTPSGLVAADLIISEGGVEIKYNVYLHDAIVLQFHSMDRSHAELAALLLRLAGVTAKVRGEGGGEGWHVKATTGRLAAGREELRNAIAKLVETARVSGWVDEKKARRWLEELKKGHTSAEGRPGYLIRLDHHGTLVVKYQSTKPDRIEREAQRLENMGLTRGVHFTVKMPEGGGRGYVWIRREGLVYAAWLSVRGEGEQRRLAAEFVSYILQRAEEEGEDVYRKAGEIVKEGKARDSLKLEGFEGRVEVGGREHVVKVIGGGAEFEKSESGKKLLRIRITAEVDGVRSEYTITYGRYSKNAVMGFAYARADAPGGREADAERLAAVIKAITGKEPWIRRMKDGTIMIVCGRAHLEGFKHYAELTDAVERWLKETRR